MRVLLDTHVLLWWLADDARLSADHRSLISDPANEVMVSAVSVAEIAIKTSLGKLQAPPFGAVEIGQEGFQAIEFRVPHAATLRDLPWIHRDPFDRMLVAQAMVEELTLLTGDERIRRYDVRLR